MIEMAWKDIFRNQALAMALSKLSTSLNLEFKVTYHVSRIVAKVDQQQREAEQLFQKLLLKHGEKGEKGEIIIVEEKRPAFEAEYKEFGETKFTIDKNKINLADLSKAGLSAADIIVLEPFLYNLELSEGVPDGKKEESKKSV